MRYKCDTRHGGLEGAMEKMAMGGRQLEVLSGWKDIAAYLGKGVRTVQRYESTFGLPVRRPAGKSASSVLATKAELDAWVHARPLRRAFELTKTGSDNVVVIGQLRRLLGEMRKLRLENGRLRSSLHSSCDQLRANLQAAMAEIGSTSTSADGSMHDVLEHRGLADVLNFDSAKKKVN
jgi:hypothetical protein